jgi:hypothetical protein
MSESILIKDDGEYLFLLKYLHGDSDSFPDWAFDAQGNQRYSDEILETDAYAGYEVPYYYRIRKSTAEFIHET